MRQSGYTLIEVTVVLVLLTVAATVVAPSLFVPAPQESSPLHALVREVRAVSVRRGEVVRLRIDRSGAWQALPGDPLATEPLGAGWLPDQMAEAIELVFSPLGTCGFGAANDPRRSFDGLDPLTCEVLP